MKPRPFNSLWARHPELWSEYKALEEENLRLRNALAEAITHFGIISSFDGDDPDCPFEDPGSCARAALHLINNCFEKKDGE